MSFEFEKVAKLRIAGCYLLFCSEFVVGEIKIAVKVEGQVDQSAQRGLRLFQTFGRVIDVQIEDDAGVGAIGPGQKGFVVLLDQADRAVDDAASSAPEQGSRGAHEIRQGVPRDIEFG